MHLRPLHPGRYAMIRRISTSAGGTMSWKETGSGSEQNARILLELVFIAITFTGYGDEDV